MASKSFSACPPNRTEVSYARSTPRPARDHILEPRAGMAELTPEPLDQLRSGIPVLRKRLVDHLAEDRAERVHLTNAGGVAAADAVMEARNEYRFATTSGRRRTVRGRSEAEARGRRRRGSRGAVPRGLQVEPCVRVRARPVVRAVMGPRCRVAAARRRLLLARRRCRPLRLRAAVGLRQRDSAAGDDRGGHCQRQDACDACDSASFRRWRP